MKILQLISSTGFFGAESVVIELSKELNAQNIENIIGVFENSHNPHTEIVQHARKNNLKTRIFPCAGRLDLKTLSDIKKFIEKNDIDVIHTHGTKPNAYGFAVSRLLKKPIVFTCHNWTENALVDISNSLTKKIANKYWFSIDKYIVPRFDRVIAVSDEVKEKLIDRKVNENKISIIYNGVDLKKFKNPTDKDLRKEFKINKGSIVVGTVARFTAEKGLFNLLQAAKEVSNPFPNVTFLFVGDGPLKEDLLKKSAELGIREKIIFTGFRNDLPELYSAMDIFVLPSLNEGLPMVILEAMASRKPVISTKVGAIPTVIGDNKEGLLVAPGDAAGLAEAMLSLLKKPGLAANLAESAYNKVIKGFSSKTMADKYIEIYQGSLKRGCLLHAS